MGQQGEERAAETVPSSHRPPARRMLTCTLPACHTCLVAQVADASVAAPQVLTHTVGTDVGVKGTLVDVCSGKRASAAALLTGVSTSQVPLGLELQPRSSLMSHKTRVSRVCRH